MSQRFYMEPCDQLERKSEVLRKSDWMATQTRFLMVTICIPTFQGLIFDFRVSEIGFRQHKDNGLLVSH